MTSPAIDLQFGVRLAASLDGLAAEMRARRRAEEDLAADVSFITVPAIGFAAVPYAPPGWGPNTGFNWAVQRITIIGFGATTDFVTVYRGTSVTHVQPQNALYTFQEAVAGAGSAWHPGRTALILKGDESLVFGGTFTGSTGYANIDVIQVTDAQLPRFLV